MDQYPSQLLSQWPGSCNIYNDIVGSTYLKLWNYDVEIIKLPSYIFNIAKEALWQEMFIQHKDETQLFFNILF